MAFRRGDIIAYTPESLFRRDGYAEVRSEWRTDGVYGQDTFDQRDTRLTDAELATGKVLFNLDDFEERQFINEADYAPDDVAVLDTRKGMVKRTFLRRRATELSEAERLERHRQTLEQAIVSARRHLLSPERDQEYVQSPIPEMTEAEVASLAETLRWVERASRAFDTSLGHLVRILNTGNGNLHFQTVLIDEDHYELVRARRALDKELTALRS